MKQQFEQSFMYEPLHEISINVVCVTSKASYQPVHTRNLIRALASRLPILRVEHHLELLGTKEAEPARLSLQLSICHTFGNRMSRLFYAVAVVVVVWFFLCFSLLRKTTKV